MALIFFIMILFILFFKIPIKFDVLITKNKKVFRVFNKSLLKKSNVSNKSKSRKRKLDDLLSKVFLRDFLASINRIKRKPKVKLEGFINYSLGDASLTAISYGLFSTFAAFLFKISKNLVDYKKSNLVINPLLEKNFNYALKFKCIIYISLVQIIHITILFIISYLKSKEVSLFGEQYE